jgi:hypothetical protein
MKLAATGSDLRSVARFRDAIKNDPNFFYHFDELDSKEVRVASLSEELNYNEKMDFTVKLPLKSAPTKRRGR